MVSQYRIYPVFGAQLIEFGPYRVNLPGTVSFMDIIAGANDQVFVQCVRLAHNVADGGQRHEKAVMQIRELHDGKSIEFNRQIGHRYVVGIYLKQVSFDEKRITGQARAQRP